MSGKIKILIADDNKDFANLLKEIFSMEEDMEVVGVSYNGRECIRDIVEYQPDILFVDGIMPELDGMGVLKYIKENKLEVENIIMMTSFGQEEMTKQALHNGASYFIIKPFDFKYAIQYIRDITYKTEETDLSQFNVYGANRQKNIEDEIQNLLLRAGVPANVKGFIYLKEAIQMIYNDMTLTGAITTVIYPEVAEKYVTKPTRVERSIRHAISLAWNNGENIFFEKMFHDTLDVRHYRPTNGQFMFLLAERLRKSTQEKLLERV